MNDQQLQHLTEAAQQDELYQEIQALLSIYEPEYQRILRTLSREDQYFLHMYVAVRESIESRIARTAYFLTPRR